MCDLFCGVHFPSPRSLWYQKMPVHSGLSGKFQTQSSTLQFFFKLVSSRLLTFCESKKKVHRNQVWHCPNFFLVVGIKFQKWRAWKLCFFLGLIWGNINVLVLVLIFEKKLFATSSYVYNNILLFDKHNLLVNFSFHDFHNIKPSILMIFHFLFVSDTI